MEKITHSQLVALLAAQSGAIPIGILAETEEKLRKTGNPFGVVTKRIRTAGFVGADYETSVKNQSGNAGFRADSLSWGEWLIPGKVITHKGETYLRTQTTSGMRRTVPARVLFLRGENGQFLSREQVAPFKPAIAESAKQAEAGLSGASAQVWVRTYKFSSLLRVRVGGKSYQVAH